jgi:hypothetical protein
MGGIVCRSLMSKIHFAGGINSARKLQLKGMQPHLLGRQPQWTALISGTSCDHQRDAATNRLRRSCRQCRFFVFHPASNELWSRVRQPAMPDCNDLFAEGASQGELPAGSDCYLFISTSQQERSLAGRG